jgi:thioredoxin-like negative regulator of GroEL
MALYLADENLAGALAVLDELRAVGVAERTLQVMRGDLLLASGRYKDAAAAYAAMRSTGRDTREFMLRWVSARRSAGIADPLRPLVEYLAREPLDSQLRIALAEQLSQLGQPTAAIREYRRVLAHDADNVVALNNLAWLLAETGSGTLDEAVARRRFSIPPVGCCTVRAARPRPCRCWSEPSIGVPTIGVCVSGLTRSGPRCATQPANGGARH